MEVVAETDRMLLRWLTEGDAGALAALYGDPRVMRFITPELPSAAEVAASILPAYLQEYRDLAGGLGSFAAVDKESGQLAGRFSLKPAHSYGLSGGTEPEPGLRVGDLQGMGLVGIGIDEFDADLSVVGNDHGRVDQTGDTEGHVRVVRGHGLDDESDRNG